MPENRSMPIKERNGFLWSEDEDQIEVRTNTESKNRSIEKIPIEELSKAGYIILTNAGTMTRDDVIVETARLYGYSRTGQKIKNRMAEAIDRLVEIEAVEESPKGNLHSLVVRSIDDDRDRSPVSCLTDMRSSLTRRPTAVC